MAMGRSKDRQGGLWLAAGEGAGDEILEQLSEGQVVVLGERLEHLDQALFEAKAGLHSRDALGCCSRLGSHGSSQQVEE
jgi:hypothetical protein